MQSVFDADTDVTQVISDKKSRRCSIVYSLHNQRVTCLVLAQERDGQPGLRERLKQWTVQAFVPEFFVEAIDLAVPHVPALLQERPGAAALRAPLPSPPVCSRPFQRGKFDGFVIGVYAGGVSSVGH